jgi:hypothetical protein
MKNISKLSILVLMLVFVCRMQKQNTTETTAIENSDNTEGQLYPVNAS